MDFYKLTACCLLIFIVGCGKKKHGIHPFQGDITEAVYASGKIKAEGQYQVFSTVNGILTGIQVAAGDTVKQNQVLFRIENATAALNSENARLALELTETNGRSGSDRLQEMEENMNLAKEKYLLDSSLFARQKTLWDQNIGTKTELDQRRLGFQSSKTSFYTSVNRLNQIKLQLKNEMERARVSYKISKKLDRDFFVKSQMDGMIFDILRNKGELITTQTPLAVIGKFSNYYIELQVNETDISRLKPNQKVELTMDGFKGQVFEAAIDRIYPIMNERTRNFRVDARFVKAPDNLFPNMNAEANIIIQVKKNAITIPRNYLVDGKYVIISDKEKREVKTGLRDFQKVEILSGLDTTMEIFNPVK